jgi:hypothetical protein
MVDLFPFPRIVGKTPEEQIAELINYLTQFKETLEFALMNISTDNLSAELINKLNELGANIEKSIKDKNEEFAQISNKSLTVSDVCNSDLFKTSVDSQISSITFSVNFTTGYLDFTTS